MSWLSALRDPACCLHQTKPESSSGWLLQQGFPVVLFSFSLPTLLLEERRNLLGERRNKSTRAEKQCLIKHSCVQGSRWCGEGARSTLVVC